MTLSKTLLCIYIDSRAALHLVQADHAPIFFFSTSPSPPSFLIFYCNLQTQKSPRKYDAMHILLAILALPARYGEDPFNNSGFSPSLLFAIFVRALFQVPALILLSL